MVYGIPKRWHFLPEQKKVVKMEIDENRRGENG
jgi:hypothetical protein